MYQQNEDKAEKFNEAIAKLMELWQEGKVSENVSVAIIARQKNDRPSSTWSVGNRMIMQVVGGTDDARGMNQWNMVKRKVNKGEKSFSIWGPLFKKYTNDKNEEVSYCYGFKAIPVFAKETTDGEPIVYPDHKPLVLPPLYDVAASMGIEVEYIPHRGFDATHTVTEEQAKIKLATHDAPVFLKEIVNVLYERIQTARDKKYPDRKRTQTADSIMEGKSVIDLSTAVICDMYGLEGYTMMPWNQMQDYFSRKPDDVLRVMTKLMSETEEIVSELMK